MDAEYCAKVLAAGGDSLQLWNMECAMNFHRDKEFQMNRSGIDQLDNFKGAQIPGGQLLRHALGLDILKRQPHWPWVYCTVEPGV